MPDLPESIDRLADETRFSGVVRLDEGESVVFEKAYGFADRAWGVENTVDTRFALASGVKGLTALTIAALVDRGDLAMATTARSLLGPDLHLIADDVTVEQLLAHRSGIGDYIDEDAGGDITDYVLPVPVHELASTEQYLRVLDGHPAKFPPGERFSYCNSGFVVLALLAERATRSSFHDLVARHVCVPAGMSATEFLRSDEPSAGVATGYLTADGPRTNVLHLPVVGSGDGGIHSTVADVHALWRAMFDGRIVPPPLVADLVRPRSDVPSESRRYGLGFWLHRSSDAVMMEGYDAGVSFRSVHDPTAATTYTVVSNTSDGAWPLVRLLDGGLPG